jgi:hypothetical protein
MISGGRYIYGCADYAFEGGAQAVSQVRARTREVGAMLSPPIRPRPRPRPRMRLGIQYD